MRPRMPVGSPLPVNRFQVTPPSVERYRQPAPRPAPREVPGWPACLPQRGINDAWIVRIEADIDRAGVLVLVQHLRPGLAAIGRTEHAAFGIRPEGVPER